MSYLTGKCDFYDHISIFAKDDIDGYIKKIRVFTYGNELVPLDIKSPKDLVPYYPYLVAMSTGGALGDNIYLSKESYIDTHERDYLEWRMKNIKAAYRRAKRKHVPFTFDFVKECLYTTDSSLKTMQELFEKVKADGEKADIDGVHTEYAERERKEFFELMVEAGYSPQQAGMWIYKSFEFMLRAEPGCQFEFTIPSQEETDGPTKSANAVTEDERHEQTT